LITSNPVLAVHAVSKSYGGRTILSNVSLRVHTSNAVCVTGSNGSGKTTLLDVICGLVRCDVGNIVFKDKEISEERPWRIARLGIVRTFQETRPFSSLTPVENLIVAVPKKAADSFAGVFFRPWLTRRETIESRDRGKSTEAKLLNTRARLFSASLSFGQRRLLEIARTLCTEPTLVLLDEPVSALSASNKRLIVSVIDRLRSEGKAILFVEHDLNVIQQLADYVYEINAGTLTFEGDKASFNEYIQSRSK
jgi:ABC-type branched-subunit amino acid transport system ATPase component